MLFRQRNRSDLRSGIAGSEADGTLRAGTEHVLAIEISGPEKMPLGARGPAWIAYHPEPAARTDLSGLWEISADGLRAHPGVGGAVEVSDG